MSKKYLLTTDWRELSNGKLNLMNSELNFLHAFTFPQYYAHCHPVKSVPSQIINNAISRITVIVPLPSPKKLTVCKWAWLNESKMRTLERHSRKRVAVKCESCSLLIFMSWSQAQVPFASHSEAPLLVNIPVIKAKHNSMSCQPTWLDEPVTTHKTIIKFSFQIPGMLMLILLIKVFNVERKNTLSKKT